MMNAPFTNLTASGNKGESFKVGGTTVALRQPEWSQLGPTCVWGVARSTALSSAATPSARCASALCKKPQPPPAQVLVDLDTPGTVLDEVRTVLEAHLRASPLEFNGVLGVNFNTSANPLKMTLNVYYEFSHNGGGDA